MSAAPDTGLFLALFRAASEDDKRAFLKELGLTPVGVRADDLNIREAAEYRRKSPKSVRRAIECGELKAHKVTSRWTITVADLDDWIARGGHTKKTTVPGASTRSRPTSASSAADAIRGAGRS